jgi:hypothetical protein
MRRAKLILSGVALFALVGGAFAFKATRGVTSFCRVSAQPGVCTFQLNNATVYTTAAPTSGVTTYCTLSPTAQCSATVTSVSITF